MDNRTVIYYSDELNEEFSTVKIEPREIDEKYKYIHKNPLWNIGSFFVHQILSLPIKIGYSKIKFKFKVVGKEKYKPYKRKGFFVYGNHTQSFGDTFFISNSLYPKRNYMIVNPENVSIKGMGNFVQTLGAIPIPTKRSGMKNFLNAIETRIKQGYSITIFPEAHIWPYYTKIRPFKSVSFKYPVEYNVPIFCATNTYQAYGKNNDKIRIVMYIDGPFFPDKNLTPKEQKEQLRNIAYKTMCERSKYSNIEHIKYIKKEDNITKEKEEIKI
ncbi:MAG: 1-acyl-sn-glycerol-3-phosphate acyltransferase [Clostridia bacterium]|nr:1-acyl-sn-glycerol-3-phosphate acyltransferase [Clostridia bacterium]